MQTRTAHARGFTLTELLIITAIAALLTLIGIQSYAGYVNSLRINQAEVDIARLGTVLERHRSDNDGFLPDGLDELGSAVPEDPWGRPYVFLNIEDGPPSIRGRVRKDRNLVPLNNDYDLYSLGADGDSRPPLAPPVSHDDILRANNGGYVGLGGDY